MELLQLKCFKTVARTGKISAAVTATFRRIITAAEHKAAIRAML